MAELWAIIVKLGSAAGDVGQALFQLGMLVRGWLLFAVWVAWWLWAVDWRKLGPTLARGAWAPVVLLGLIAAAAWSMAAPGEADWGAFVVPNFLWQLGAVASLIGVALLCGWLQGRLGWTPPEIPVEP